MKTLSYKSSIVFDEPAAAVSMLCKYGYHGLCGVACPCSCHQPKSESQSGEEES